MAIGLHSALTPEVQAEEYREDVNAADLKTSNLQNNAASSKHIKKNIFNKNALIHFTDAVRLCLSLVVCDFFCNICMVYRAVDSCIIIAPSCTTIR